MTEVTDYSSKGVTKPPVSETRNGNLRSTEERWEGHGDTSNFLKEICRSYFNG